MQSSGQPQNIGWNMIHLTLFWPYKTGGDSNLQTSEAYNCRHLIEVGSSLSLEVAASL